MATPKKKSPRRNPNMEPYVSTKAQLPAKRTDPDKQWRAQVVLTNVLDRVQNPEAALREILAIFGYEVEA